MEYPVKRCPFCGVCAVFVDEHGEDVKHEKEGCPADGFDGSLGDWNKRRLDTHSTVPKGFGFVVVCSERDVSGGRVVGDKHGRPFESQEQADTAFVDIGQSLEFDHFEVQQVLAKLWPGT